MNDGRDLRLNILRRGTEAKTLGPLRTHGWRAAIEQEGYRPSIWRRVQHGDLDHLRVLVEAYPAVVERKLPEQFLEQVLGQRVFAKLTGSLY